MATPAEIEDLIGKMSLGDRRAFSAIYSATSAKLFGVVLRILNNRADAEEVLQEAYVKIWQNAGKYQVNGLSPMTWLITIARNQAIDRLRARRAPTSDLSEADAIADPGPGPEALAIAASDGERISACMEHLGPDKADAVRRAYLLGETYEDLAAHYRIPLNTVRTWLRRSLQNLRECLST